MEFKASRKKSDSYGAYRKIIKSGDTSIDINAGSDDVITIYTIDFATGLPIYKSLSIDCDKKTGKFRIFYQLI